MSPAVLAEDRSLSDILPRSLLLLLRPPLLPTPHALRYDHHESGDHYHYHSRYTRFGLYRHRHRHRHRSAREFRPGDP